MTIPPNKLLGPVAAWAFLQLALLGIGASGFPLWAHHPLPRESLALPILLCGQILFFSMLFPILAGNVWALAINLVLMLPFDELAGLLSNSSHLMIAQGWLCVGMWGVGLGLWRNYQLVTTLALLFTAGGAVLDYLRWEAFLADGRQDVFRPLSLLPNLSLMNGVLCWVETAIPLITGLIALLFTGLIRLKKVPPLPSTTGEIASKTVF